MGGHTEHTDAVCMFTHLHAVTDHTVTSVHAAQRCKLLHKRPVVHCQRVFIRGLYQGETAAGKTALQRSSAPANQQAAAAAARQHTKDASKQASRSQLTLTRPQIGRVQVVGRDRLRIPRRLRGILERQVCIQHALADILPVRVLAHAAIASVVPLDLLKLRPPFRERLLQRREEVLCSETDVAAAGAATSSVRGSGPPGRDELRGRVAKLLLLD